MIFSICRGLARDFQRFSSNKKKFKNLFLVSFGLLETKKIPSIMAANYRNMRLYRRKRWCFISYKIWQHMCFRCNEFFFQSLLQGKCQSVQRDERLREWVIFFFKIDFQDIDCGFDFQVQGGKHSRSFCVLISSIPRDTGRWMSAHSTFSVSFSFSLFFFLEWRAERKREGGKGRGNNNNNNKNNNNNNKTNNNNNNKKGGRKGRRAHKDARRSAAASGPGPAPRAPSVESRTRMTKHAPRSLDLTATWIFVLFFFLLSAPTGYDRAVYPRLSALSNVIDSEDFGTQKKKTNKKSSPTWKWPSDEIDLRPRGDRWPDEYGKLGTTR